MKPQRRGSADRRKRRGWSIRATSAGQIPNYSRAKENALRDTNLSSLKEMSGKIASKRKMSILPAFDIVYFHLQDLKRVSRNPKFDTSFQKHP